MSNYHDDFFKNHRPSLIARIGFGAWFIFCAVISLAFLGLMAWAVVELVQWVTSK